MAAPRSGGRVDDRLAEVVLGYPARCGEGGGVRHRDFGEHPPVHVDAGGLQAVDEPVVGDAGRPRGGVDPLDPQAAERALAVLAARIGVSHRVEHLLLGLAVHPRPLAAVPARPLKHHLALLVGVDGPLHACHFRLPGGGLGYLASNFLIFLVSAGASVTSPASRRVTLLDLCSKWCLRFARRRSTFPVPVRRKRLLAPLCVFIFGMLAAVFLLLRACGAALSCVPPGSRHAARCLSTSPAVKLPGGTTRSRRPQRAAPPAHCRASVGLASTGRRQPLAHRRPAPFPASAAPLPASAAGPRPPRPAR